ncbi:MAG: RNA polymerase sigma factor FliA [Myxococcales bacterium]|nr:RNA polymerase sigma factor FliA [Myxococcales bacterium]
MLNTNEAYALDESLDRESLIARGLPLVRRIAFRLARRLPPSVDVGDLIGAGSEGLLKAVTTYDPSGAARFEWYAERRIRGAILDELRTLDAVTRHGRRRMLEVSTAISALRVRLGRQPEEDEVADELGISLDEYQQLSMQLARGAMLGRLGQVEPDTVQGAGDSPADRYADAELRHRLARAIEQLPQRTQMVLALYYQEECTQAEIAEVLGVTESRVCQILGESAARLRSILDREDRVRGMRA